MSNEIARARFLLALKEDAADDADKTQIDNVDIDGVYTRTPYSRAIFNYFWEDTKAKL